MTRARLLAAALCLAANPALAAEPLRFWNLTTSTITRLTLAPAGTSAFGPDQCANDRDGSVDHDERLRLAGIEPGRYDVQLVTKAGRACTIRGVEVRQGGKYAFSLQDSDLTECK
jgi:hypothetical protein